MKIDKPWGDVIGEFFQKKTGGNSWAGPPSSNLFNCQLTLMKCARSNDLAALVIFPMTDNLSVGICICKFALAPSAAPPVTAPMSFATIMLSKRMR